MPLRLLVVYRRVPPLLYLLVEPAVLFGGEHIAGEMLYGQRKRRAEILFPLRVGALRHPEDEVDGEVAEPGGAGVFHRFDGLPRRVPPPHKAQHIIIKRLHPDAESADAQTAQPPAIVRRELLGIGFQGDLLQILKTTVLPKMMEDGL